MESILYRKSLNNVTRCVEFDNARFIGIIIIGSGKNKKLILKKGFGKELRNFAIENNLCICDIEYLGADSKNFTFLSESHGRLQAGSIMLFLPEVCAFFFNDFSIRYDVVGSDHFPFAFKYMLDNPHVVSKILINVFVMIGTISLLIGK